MSDKRYLPFPLIAAPPVVLPAAYRPSLMERPSRVTLIVSRPRPLTVSESWLVPDPESLDEDEVSLDADGEGLGEAVLVADGLGDDDG